MKPVIIIVIAFVLLIVGVGYLFNSGILVVTNPQDNEEQILREQRENEEELRQQEERRLREQGEFEEELRQQKIYAEQERQRLEEQRLIEEAKASIRLQAIDSPLLQGIINGGKLSFWVESLENHNVSNNVSKGVDYLISELDGKWINGVKLSHTNSKSNADFTINWAVDYNPNHIGRQIGNHLIVGLGSSTCGSWKPFDAISVFEVAYHEVGHALGQNHSNNSNNVMYTPADNIYEYDYKDTIFLSDGYRQQISFCNTGDIFFTTEKAFESSASYELYVITPSTDASDFVFRSEGKYFPDCSGDLRQTYNSISKNCDDLQSGAKLVLYNPTTFGYGADATIKVEIRNANDHKNIDFDFESSSSKYTQEYLDYVKELFR